MTQPLSPAAQAVLDAAHDGANTVLFDIGNDSPVPMCAAAALRAIADNAPAPHYHEEMAFHSGFWAGIEYIRSIATELEAHHG